MRVRSICPVCRGRADPDCICEGRGTVTMAPDRDTLTRPERAVALLVWAAAMVPWVLLLMLTG